MKTLKKPKIQKENRVVCACRKCNKPFSYDKKKGCYKFGDLCRECAMKEA